MLPQTKSDLKDYIKRKLGGDFVPLELSDNNMDDVISEAIVFFQQNFYGFSTDILLFIPWDEYLKDANNKVKDGVYQYLLPENVFSVMQVINDRSLGNSGYWGKGTVPVDDANFRLGGNNGFFSHYQYVDIDLMQQNFSMVESKFLKRSMWNFNHNNNTLYLYSNGDDYSGGVTLMCNVFDNIDNDGGIITKYFQEPKFLEYVEIQASQQMYSNLKKFGQNELPDGMTVNIEEYKKDDEIKELREKIIYDYCDPEIYSIFGENDF